MKEVVAEGHQVSFRKEKADLDRASKETMKSLELLTKVSLEDQKLKSDSDMKSLDMITKLAIEKQKSGTDDKKIRARVLEKAADIEKEKDIKAAELINQTIREETKRKGD
jgi:hypothetical protein